MVLCRIIPSLLLRGDRLVKGRAFSDWRDAGNPVTTARTLNAQKSDELLLLDIDAGIEGRGPNLSVVEAMARECRMPLTVGGGITSISIATGCILHGADKIFLGSAALRNPELIDHLAHHFGSQAVVVGIDVLGSGEGAKLYAPSDVKGPPSWMNWLYEAVQRGAGEIRLCSVEREGFRQGIDIDLWRLARETVEVPIVIEGGAGTLDHLDQALKEGIDAVAIGTMIVFSDNNIIQIKRYLKNAGHSVRM